MITYSTDTDVLNKISHIKTASGIFVSAFRENAHSQINIELQKLYEVPIVSTKESEQLYISNIESDIAGGLLVMDVYFNSENLHAYGESLVKRGEEKLSKIISESIVLTGVPLNTDYSDDMINAPKIQGMSADEYGTFDRPMSGIENDALNGVIDTKEYNSLTDVKTL